VAKSLKLHEWESVKTSC